MSNNDEALIYRVYKQNRKQWDDDSKIEVYFLTIAELEDEYVVHRYEVNEDIDTIAFFAIEPVRVQRRWFLDNHSLVSNQVELLRGMQSAVKDQVAEANTRAVVTAGFYRRFTNIVERSIPRS